MFSDFDVLFSMYYCLVSDVKEDRLHTLDLKGKVLFKWLFSQISVVLEVTILIFSNLSKNIV